MDLFVINRYEGDIKEKTEDEKQNEEKEKLNKLLKKIERNKKLREKQKEKESKQKAAKKKTIEHRELKRKIKASFIPVPENNNDEFIDKSVIETVDEPNKIENEENKKIQVDPSNLSGFTVLGAEKFANKKKVKRVLPNWLVNPTIISVNLHNLNIKVSGVKLLDKGLRKLLKANGIKYFFPVQAEVIPWLLEANKNVNSVFPRDICVSAPTGSGKTLTFVLPVIQALKKYAVKKIRALVILPTQDLAMQVFKTFKFYSQNTNIEICQITGANSFAIEQQQLIQENKAFGTISKIDILVCTAGRLVDHLKLTKGFTLQDLKFLIIDEADRVLDNVQNDWLYHLERHLYRDEPIANRVLNLYTLQKKRPPQKLLFSATLSQDPEKLQKLSLFQPKLFTSIVENEDVKSQNEPKPHTFIGKYTTPKELIEKFIVTSLDIKPLCLYKFIKLQKLTRSIVFTHSVESAHRLAILLRTLFKDDLKIEEVSSHLQGKSRSQLIDKFANSEVDLLVCTDALARGMDLPNVQCVISYSAPKHLKTYIHRVGRTARAGEEGLAITMLNKSQLFKFKAMLNQADKNNVEELLIAEDDLEPLVEQYKEALQELRRVVEKEDTVELQKSISSKRVKSLKRKRKTSSVTNGNK